MGVTAGTGGTELHYDDHGGDGPAVVLVHGITESSPTWDPIVQRLVPGHRVITMDLRGHGQSGDAADYSSFVLGGDLVAIIKHLELSDVHIVGHSLGGIVVTVAGALHSVTSIVNVDQALQLGAFSDQVRAFGDQLRDPEAFPLLINAMFDLMVGDQLGESERDRLAALRSPNQQAVLGVWGPLLTQQPNEVQATIDELLAAYHDSSVPYLSLFGNDPGEGYGDWLRSTIPAATAEVWPDSGHYPHLVDPDRFVARLNDFWATGR